MTDAQPSVDAETLLALREARLDAALAQWRDFHTDDPLLLAMRARVVALGLDAVVARSLTDPEAGGAAAGLVLLVERLLDGAISFDAALALARRPDVLDSHRVIAVLYACADPQRHQNAVDIGVLRVVGETAQDPELAARAYLQLGDLSGADNNSTAHAYAAALNKSVLTALTTLQARCLVSLARVALRMQRPAEAADNAGLARQLYERDGDAVNAGTAVIIEAMGRLENGEAAAAADAIRPVVARQLRDGLADKAIDANVIMKHSIRDVAKPAFQQAMVADPAAVATYDAALALAGDSGYVYPDEVADRTLIGQCLLRGDDPGAGAGQLALAIRIARDRHDDRGLLNALTASCDWLVHRQDPQALDATAEALALALTAGDPAALPMLMTLRGSALCQAGRIEEGLQAYQQALDREFRIGWHAALITVLFGAGRDERALGAVKALIAAIRQQDTGTLSGDEEHVTMLLSTLLVKGHPGLAQQVREALAGVNYDKGEGLGSPRRLFVVQARETLAHAGAQLTASEHDAVAQMLVPLLQEAQAHDERSIMLSAAYMLAENALAGGHFDDALAYLQTVLEGSGNDGSGMRAAALNRIGTVYCLGFKRYELALEYQEQAIALQRALGDMHGLVVSLVQAAQTCVALGRLDDAQAYADELRELGPRYPPQDVEWLSYVPALVDAYRHRWDRARPVFRRTIAELEHKRGEYTSAAAQRQWCTQKAFMYGNAIEAAIMAGDCEEAITYLELARNRYLSVVAREHGIRRREDMDIPAALIEGRGPVTAAMLAQRVPANGALVWCGGFPRGLGIVVARREGNGVVLTSSFSPEITGHDLTELFQGDVSRILAAQRAGRSVEFIIEAALSERDLSLGANPYWQGRGERWNRSMGEAVETLAKDLWPKILATIGRPVSNVVLLPSVGCSELPLCAAAPARWPDGMPLATSTVPGLDVLPDRISAPVAAPVNVVQIVNPSEDTALVCCPVEVDAVRRLFDQQATTVRGRRASTRRVAQAMRDAQVFHFVGHAFCDWHDPLDSGLICANRRDGPSVLRVRDLFDLVGAIDTPLIVLSACQIGNVQAGDTQNDFLNLPAALIAAGAHAVVAPRWLVDDVAASMLLASMFERWRRDHMPLIEALAAARWWLRDEVTRADVERWLAPRADAIDARRLEALRSRFVETYRIDERPFSHVAHWGAFELTGDASALGTRDA